MSGFYASAKVTPCVHQNQDFALGLIQATLPVQELSKAFSHLTFPSMKTCLSGSQLPPKAGMNSGSDATGDWGCKGETASPCIMTQYLQNVLGNEQVPCRRALRVSEWIQCAPCWREQRAHCCCCTGHLLHGETLGSRTGGGGGCCGFSRCWEQAGLMGSVLIPLE